MNPDTTPRNLDFDGAEPLEASHRSMRELDRRMDEWLDRREQFRSVKLSASQKKAKEDQRRKA